jgi:hypothetical protein
VGIVGGLLIAAAFLAFVAANWSAIPRVGRFAMLLGGIAGAYGLGAAFAHTNRPFLADTAVGVGAIVFGASIALVGQMYHLAGDFAAALLLWGLGALAAAVLTSSRSALAVALVAGCAWSWARMFEFGDTPHLSFVAFWLLAAGLALLWNSPAARHLVSSAALAWWAGTSIGMIEPHVVGDPVFVLAAGSALMLGGCLLAEACGSEPIRALGATGASYGAFAIVPGLVLAVAEVFSRSEPAFPPWVTGCGILGLALAIIATVLARRPGLALASAAIALSLVAAGLGRQDFAGREWLTDATAIAAALCLIISGTLDDKRPRLVAGWVGLAIVIATITWMVKGSLLERSIFLAVAGCAAIALALGLGRMLPKEDVR